MIETIAPDQIEVLTTHTCNHTSKRTYTNKRLAIRYDAKGALELCPNCKEELHKKLKHQIRAARSLLMLSREALCIAAGVALETLVRIENGKKCDDDTLKKLRQSLEACGATFIEADEHGGYGVRFEF